MTPRRKAPKQMKRPPKKAPKRFKWPHLYPSEQEQAEQNWRCSRVCLRLAADLMPGKYNAHFEGDPWAHAIATIERAAHPRRRRARRGKRRER
jgi:hypothetical protein